VKSAFESTGTSTSYSCRRGGGVGGGSVGEPVREVLMGRVPHCQWHWLPSSSLPRARRVRRVPLVSVGCGGPGCGRAWPVWGTRREAVEGG
jgi:hypothetical protein